MKRLLGAAALLAASLSAPVLATDIGVSLSIGQPGFYGRIDVGGYPPPQLIYQQPRYIERVPVGRAPIYLHVPPGHRKHWSRYCREYNACREPVYFVQNNWYAREYVPRYEQRHDQRRYDERRYDERRDERSYDDRGDRGGRGRGHGHGHDR